MPPLPIASRPASNCGLTRNTPLARRRREIERRRQRQLQRNEADVADEEIRALARRRSAAARSRAFSPSMQVTRGSARKAGMHLAVADIDGDDMGRAALEQHLREAAGRGADVERVAAGRIEAEMVEPGDQLQRRARDIALRRIVDGDLARAGNGSGRAWRRRAVDGTVPRSTASRARERLAKRPRWTSSSSSRMRSCRWRRGDSSAFIGESRGEGKRRQSRSDVATAVDRCARCLPLHGAARAVLRSLANRLRASCGLDAGRAGRHRRPATTTNCGFAS